MPRRTQSSPTRSLRGRPAPAPRARPACGWCPPLGSVRRPAATYRDTASIARLIPHLANKIPGGLPLMRHRVGRRAQCSDVDPLAWRLDCGDLRDRLASARDTHRRTAAGTLDQLTQARLGRSEADTA